MRLQKQLPVAATLMALQAEPAKAECFNCNYGLGIFLLACMAVAGATLLIGLGWFIMERRVPRAVTAVFLLSGSPPLLAWLGVI